MTPVFKYIFLVLIGLIFIHIGYTKYFKEAPAQEAPVKAVTVDQNSPFIERIQNNDPSLKEVSFPNGQPLRSGDGKTIGEALKSNTHLRSLEISYNLVGDDGAKAFAEALKNNTTLEDLMLIDNGIGVAGLEALEEALKVNTTLQYLNLDGNVTLYEPGFETHARLEKYIERNRQLRAKAEAASKSIPA
jgi:Ran GTPase-activating protein (RanGAP) involved in mRNA processing and transport